MKDITADEEQQRELGDREKSKRASERDIRSEAVESLNQLRFLKAMRDANQAKL